MDPKVRRRRVEAAHGDRQGLQGPLFCMCFGTISSVPWQQLWPGPRNGVPAQLITQSPSRTQALYAEEHAVSSQPTVTGGQFSLFTSCYSLLSPFMRASQAKPGGAVPCYYSTLQRLITVGDRRPKWITSWLCFCTKASDQGKRVVFQLPRPAARSGLQVAHTGSAFYRKQKGWPDTHLSMSHVIPLNLQAIAPNKRPLKNQCLPLGLHTFPKANLLSQPWV